MIDRASDRLALCPRPSTQNPAQIPYFRLCLPLALIDDDFLSKGCLCNSPVLCFLTHCIGRSAALSWDKLDLDFFDKRSVLLYPSFRHKSDKRSVLLYLSFRHNRSTIGVRNFPFGFGGRWSTDFFRQCSEKVHENTEKTTSARNRILATPPFRLLSTRVWALPSLRHRALLGK